jgi:prolyl-tRNA synthetase
MDFVWQTSWGVSTRLIGALVMAHGDDSGLVLPPALAPLQAVVVPIWKTEEEKSSVLQEVDRLTTGLSPSVRVHADLREEVSPGFKFNEWELKGVPLRIELGPKDLAKGQAVIVSRLDRRKEAIPLAAIVPQVSDRLARFQRDLYQRALQFRTENTRVAKSYAQFKEEIESLGGFFEATWCGNPQCEATIKEETKATIRLIPLDGREEPGACLFCGSSAHTHVILARAY